jgi:hypothetical protein
MYLLLFCTMSQQMHNQLKIHYTATYYTAPTCFDTIVSSSGSTQSVPRQVSQVFDTQRTVHRDVFLY